MTHKYILALVGLAALQLCSFHTSAQTPALKFKKQLIATESAECAGVFDVNGDGVLYIVSGSFWYEGPGYKKRTLISQIKRENEYFDDFSTIAMDVNGDGRMDFVTGGWFNGNLVWKENPGNNKQWTEHVIAKA